MIYSNDRGSVIDALEDFNEAVPTFRSMMFIRMIIHRLPYGGINHEANKREDEMIKEKNRIYDLEFKAILIDRLVKHV